MKQSSGIFFSVSLFIACGITTNTAAMHNHTTHTKFDSHNKKFQSRSARHQTSLGRQLQQEQQKLFQHNRIAQQNSMQREAWEARHNKQQG